MGGRPIRISTCPRALKRVQERAAAYGIGGIRRHEAGAQKRQREIREFTTTPSASASSRSPA